MATGDQADFLTRMRSVMPPWFPSTAPIVSGILTASANVCAFIYGLLAFVKQQTRIATASGGFLDLIAYDFFGLRIKRVSGQSDASFRTTINTELFRIRNTRTAISKAIHDLTGLDPVIFEPWRIADSGAWDTTTLYYDVEGCWGSRDDPYQVFVTVTQTTGVTTAQIFAAVESVRSAGITIWVKIVGAAAPLDTEGGVDILQESGFQIAT